MAGNVTPFLNVTQFEAMFRPLTSEESALAAKLLVAAAIWIRDPLRRPDLENVNSDQMAEIVSYEVVAACFPAAAPVPGMSLRGHTQYALQSDDRLESGTLAEVSGMLEFTDHHKRLLGLSLTAGPEYGGFDSGFGGYC